METNKGRIRIEYMDLDQVRKWPGNPKEHDMSGLASSLGRWGYVEPVMLDERTGRLVAGHGRIETLVELRKVRDGAPEGIEVGPNGEWLVPVVRGKEFRDEAEAEAYLLASNQLAINGGWDPGALHEMATRLLAGGTSFEGTGFDPQKLMKEAARAIRETSKRVAGEVEKPEAEPEPRNPKDPIAKPGDLWILGRHRVYCGDSTKPEDVAILMNGEKGAMVCTDPPYAIYGSSTGIGADIADDKMVRPFFEAICRVAGAHVPTFAHIYLHTDWRSWAALWEGAQRASIAVKNMLVWDKGGGLGSMYQQCHELIAFAVKSPIQTSIAQHTETGHRMVNASNILRYPRVHGAERKHNAAKPVAMEAELIANSSNPGDIVIDFFLGGGSTLLAAERTERRCYGMEIEPKHVDTIVESWEAATGKKARRVTANEPEKRVRKKKDTPLQKTS